MRYTVIVITRDRRDALLRTLGTLRAQPEPPTVIVVDNASSDGTADAVAGAFPDVIVLRARSNLGAVARNVAVDRVTTPYAAFCDDDTWWEPGAPDRAADLLDAHPRLAVVTGRIIAEPGGREDPVVAELRDSPLPRPAWLDRPAIGSFLAGASMVRVAAFRAAGGFSARLWLGGEEELLSADLMSMGWYLCYAEEAVVHHEASPVRDADLRRRHGIRNTLWFTWLRRPVRSAARRTGWLLRTVPRDRISALAFAEAVGGLPWVLRHRAVVPPHVEEHLRALELSNRRSRNYVS
jgi:N-acetylglucosaminyl-diphospho-decaprenol L-rhamnosyltransferase